RIFHYADKLDYLLYAFALAGAVVTGAALPLTTLIFGKSVASFSGVSTQGNTQEFQSRVNQLVLYYVYIFVGRFVIGYVATLCVCVAGARTTRSMRTAFFECNLRQEIWHFDKPSTGSIAAQVTTNGNRINQGIAEKLYSTVGGLSLFFSSYIVALAVQWKLALITMTIVPANFLIFGVCLHFAISIDERVTRTYSRALVVAQEAISSIKTIKAFGAALQTVKKYDAFLTEAHQIGLAKSPLMGIFFSTSVFLVLAGTALAFWEGYRLYASGEVNDVGTVFTVVLSVTLGATSIITMLPSLEAVSAASSAAGELFEVMDKKTLLDPLSPDGEKPASLTGDIEIKDLHFAYPSRPSAEVLQGMTLKLPAGKTTALVGASGSGKSTIVGLLERWYVPSTGTILLDGLDIAKYNVKWLRSNIRLVQQEPILFQGTIFENVAKGLNEEQLALPQAKRLELVKQACRSSNAHDFVERLPHGYDTQVGERASMLSGGQRQRLSIARSIISDPKVLLLDEATSALDPRRVLLTTLIIAHRLSTVKAADNIAVVANGKIVEQGSHQELLHQDGLYAAVANAQDLGNHDDKEQPTDMEFFDAEDETMFSKTTVKTDSNVITQDKVEQANAASAGYSLLRSVLTMLSEHPDLYLQYAVISFGCIIAGGTYPAQAILLSRLIGVYSLQGEEAGRQANFFALMFFVLALANLFAKFGVGWCCNNVGQVITHRYRREMLQLVLRQDQDFFDRPENASGSLSSQLSSVPAAVQELMSANFGLILNVLTNAISSSIVAIAFGWKLGLVMVFGGLTIILVGGYMRIRLDQKLDAVTGEQFSASAGLATETVTAIKTISSLTLETTVLRQYSDAMQDIVSSVIKGSFVALLPYAISQSVDFLVIALGFWYGSTLVAQGEYTVNQFFVVFLCIVFGGQGAAQFFGYTKSITKAKVAANYMFWLRALNPTIGETPTNQNEAPRGESANLAAENVDFQYKQRTVSKVLQQISFRVKSGAHAAFVGPSGCGKSTIISLLMRFYDPVSGRILFNEDDISTLSPALYRQEMSLVQQEPPLYSSSVRANITLGLDHEASEEEVLEACRQAHVLDFIQALPEGLHTPCGSNGLQFSGGQRQRIAIARALIRNPRLLLLDEATSALDTQSERIVQQALDSAAADSSRTTIAVAHRLSTIKNANVIFVMEDGRIVETGTHDQLLQQRGRYYAMCLAQALDQAHD
ncbi:ABC multidrug transporter atrC, partial [Fulvia fulva]